jgi:glycosyltransferase involved in cell wall biosynthesis
MMPPPEHAAPGAGPQISVIIPSFARPDALRRCLAALARQTCARERFEVIVVDDGSPAPLDAAVAGFRESFELTLLRQENAGPGPARNRGAASARGSLLAFTDDDCLPEPGWLEAMARQHAATPADLLGGRLVNHDPGNRYAEASQFILDGAYRFHADYPDSGRFFASNNMAVPARDFAALGGFDGAFSIASEDRDLCDRWEFSGRVLRFVDDAVVRHDPSLTLARFARQHFNYGRGAFSYQRARMRRGSGRPALALSAHGRFLRSVVQGFGQRPRVGRLHLAGLLLLWQVVNLAGYLYGAARSSSSRP